MSNRTLVRDQRDQRDQHDEAFLRGKMNGWAIATKALVVILLLIVSVVYVIAAVEEKDMLAIWQCNKGDSRLLCLFKRIAASLSLILLSPFVIHSFRLYSTLLGTSFVGMINIVEDFKKWRRFNTYVMKRSGESIFAVRANAKDKATGEVSVYEVDLLRAVGAGSRDAGINCPDERRIKLARWRYYFQQSVVAVYFSLGGLVCISATVIFLDGPKWISGLAKTDIIVFSVLGFVLFVAILHRPILFMSGLDVLQTVLVLPLSWIVIMASETPSDVLVNFVALQYFTQVDEQIVHILHNVRAAVQKDLLNYVRPTTERIDRNGFLLDDSGESALAPAADASGDEV